MISGGSGSLSPRKQDQEGWGALAQRAVCVNVPSQREHSHAEPLVIWLQIAVCCDLRMLVNCLSTAAVALTLISPLSAASVACIVQSHGQLLEREARHQ